MMGPFSANACRNIVMVTLPSETKKKTHLSSAVLTRVEMSLWSCLKEKHPVMHPCSVHICRSVVMVTHLSERETPADASLQCSHLSERRHGNTPV